MIYLSLISALMCNVSLSLLDKKTSGQLTGDSQVLRFSLFKTAACAAFAILILPFSPLTIDLPGILIGLMAGIFCALSVVLIMRALKKTLAVYVNLFMSAGIIMPTIFGAAFLSQPLTILKLACLVLLIISLALTLGVKKGGHFSLGSLLPMFICYGGLMIAQGIFPKFSPESSKAMFSLVMYGSATVLLFFAQGKRKTEEKRPLTKPLILIGLVTAAVNLSVNLLLTSLSAKLDAAIVFPTVHGMKLVAVTILSGILWKERLKPLQILGALLSILFVCGLNM
ncbi:MAG: EamA family transporter [Christensenellaceae bacterium]|nr:EamA family transporter [Christensenellaceae bacterium]